MIFSFPFQETMKSPLDNDLMFCLVSECRFLLLMIQGIAMSFFALFQHLVVSMGSFLF